LHIDVIGKGWYTVLGNELICPINSISLGAVKVIPIEFQQLTCRAIDIVDLSEETVNTLFNELNYHTDATEIAIRGRARYVKGFEKIDFEFPKEYTSFKMNGTYLITGANGKMGRIFSEFLSDKFKANLILIDITDIPTGFITDLKNNGSEVIVIREDISAGDKLREQITSAEKKSGPVNGIIHTAAWEGGAGMILKRERTTDEKVFTPKIAGTHILNTIFANKALDFFVNCSGHSASLAPVGQVALAAATIYQDAYAEAGNPSYPVISIEWPDLITGNQPGITSAQVVQVLSMAVYLQIPTQIISTVDFNQSFKNHYSGFKELKEAYTASITDQVHERPALATDFVLPHTETEKKMTLILENFFGIKNIGSEDNFFELGADSLNIMKMTALINNVFNEKIPVVTVYKFPTIQTLSEFIDFSRKGNVRESDEEMEESVSIMEGTFSLLNQHEDEE
jgi:acyl carrier protein